MLLDELRELIEQRPHARAHHDRNLLAQAVKRDAGPACASVNC